MNEYIEIEFWDRVVEVPASVVIDMAKELYQESFEDLVGTDLRDLEDYVLEIPYDKIAPHFVHLRSVIKRFPSMKDQWDRNYKDYFHIRVQGVLHD